MGFPAGTDPDDINEDLTGATEYVCMLDEGRTVAKASSLFDFTFRLRDDPSAEPGAVIINDESYNEETIDRNAANDSAKITVASGDGGSGGEGGGLPVTGANAGLIGAGGAALLLAGAAGLVLVRRRRVRFTA
jgi:LPXTG-motif cell wall-anchored protein